MKALITGGTGFVGSHVARALAESGHTVRILHRRSSKLDALAGIHYESAIGDITDLDSLHTACEGVDWVFHVAAVAAYWREDKSKMYDANVEGTRRVLIAARDAGVRRVIFTSSAAAVGLHDDGTPSDERDFFDLPPDRFPYAHTKALAERLCIEAVSAGQDVVILNPVVVLGPGDLNKISGEMILQIQRLSWTVPVPAGGVALIDVRDVARMHVAAARQGRTGERYILGTENYAYRDLFRLIARVTGSPEPGIPIPASLTPALASVIDGLRALGVPLPLDAPQTRISAQQVYFAFDKAWGELGKPLISVPQSVRETWEWYDAHGFVKPDDPSAAMLTQIARWIGFA